MTAAKSFELLSEPFGRLSIIQFKELKGTPTMGLLYVLFTALYNNWNRGFWRRQTHKRTTNKKTKSATMHMLCAQYKKLQAIVHNQIYHLKMSESPSAPAASASTAAVSSDALPTRAVSEYQKRLQNTLPLERPLPHESVTDPDVLVNHIVQVSLLMDREALAKQKRMQDAEEYALQQCTLQCKRDGRLRREKTDDADDDADRTTVNSENATQDMILESAQKLYDEGKMSDVEQAYFLRLKEFRAQLDAIPWVEGDEEVADASVDANAPKPFLSQPRAMAAFQNGSGPPPEDAPAANDNLCVPGSATTATNNEPTATVEDVDDVERVGLTSSSSDAVAPPTLSADDLRPAIPVDAVSAEITAEQLAMDPNNPEMAPVPIRERENRFSYAAKFDDLDHLTDEEIKAALAQKKAAYAEKFPDDNVAGYVADGTVIPVNNSGEHARADLPPVFEEGPSHRDKVMRERYDPKRDKPFLWKKNDKFIVVSMIGPNCPQKAPRTLLRVWGVVRNTKEGKLLMKAVLKENRYGYMWRTYMYSIQRWIDVPPKGNATNDDNGTVLEGNNQFQHYLQANFDHQKQATVELEQRALDAKAQEKTAGQRIMEQLRKNNMDVGHIDANSLPR